MSRPRLVDTLTTTADHHVVSLSTAPPVVATADALRRAVAVALRIPTRSSWTTSPRVDS